MQNTLREALRPVFTLDITGNEDADKKLCLLPGIYSTLRLIQDPSSKDAVLNYSDPTNLNNAGYGCDQVADDGGLPVKDGVKIEAVGRAKMRDFLNSVQRVGLECTEIVIMNKDTTNSSIFDTQIELAKTVLGARGGMDFITLQKYISVNAYDRNKITIDLSGLDENGKKKSLIFSPEVYMAMTVPQNAHFSIQFTFNSQASCL